MKTFLTHAWKFFIYFELKFVIPFYCVWLIPYWLMHRSSVNTFTEIVGDYVVANWKGFLYITFIFLPFMSILFAGFLAIRKKVHDVLQKHNQSGDSDGG